MPDINGLKSRDCKKEDICAEFVYNSALALATRDGFSTGLDLSDKLSPHERRILMKAFKQVLTCVFVVFALIALVGCGVSKADHEKVVSDLNKTKADLEKSTADMNKAKADLAQANSQIAAMEKSLNEAKGQSEEKVAAAQQQAGDLQAKVDSLSKENADLQGMLDKLKEQIAELQKKVGGAVQAPAKNLPAVPAKKPRVNDLRVEDLECEIVGHSQRCRWHGQTLFVRGRPDASPRKII